jgi:hypothetical protein
MSREAVDAEVEDLARRAEDSYRIGEAASALELQTAAADRMRTREQGTSWVRGLLTFARQYAAAGQHELALDLAGWAEGVAARLPPTTDAEVGSLVEDCLRSPGELLASMGAEDGEIIASSATRLATALWVEPGYRSA